MKKLLLADDSITIQKVVTLSFSGEDIEVITVDNGERAIAILDEEVPDIVLADIYMPGLNGFAVCEYIKSHERWAHIPVVLLVGTFEPFDQVEAGRVGSDGVLTKPFESSQLVSLVNQLISGSNEPDALGSADRPGTAGVEPAPLVHGAEPAQAEVEMDESAPSQTFEGCSDGVLELEWDAQVSVSDPIDENSILELFDEDLIPEAPVGAEQIRETIASESSSGHDTTIEIPPAEVGGAPLGPSDPGRGPEALSGRDARITELSDSDLNVIVEKVIERLSDQVVREIAWEVVPDMAEILIKEKMQAQQRDHPHS